MTGAVTDILRLMVGREYQVYAATGAPPAMGLKHERCPMAHDRNRHRNGDRNKSFRIDPRSWRWYCSCGNGDALDLAVAIGLAHDPLSAAAWARDVLGEEPLGQRRLTQQQRAERERKQAEAFAKAEALRLQREAEHAEYAKQQSKKALRMWLRASGSMGTIIEHYLAGRGITCHLPETLRFLPAAEPGHHPAMIAPFGLPFEYAPGRVRMPPMWLKGVHLTLLRPDGSGKAVNRDGNSKLTIGVGHSLPIVLAPANDLGGLVIAEGIEDALSAHQATGLGAWAAGTANRLPGLAQHVPAHVECVTVLVDRDPAGERYSGELITALEARGMEVRSCAA